MGFPAVYQRLTQIPIEAEFDLVVRPKLSNEDNASGLFAEATQVLPAMCDTVTYDVMKEYEMLLQPLQIRLMVAAAAVGPPQTRSDQSLSDRIGGRASYEGHRFLDRISH